MPRGLPKSRSPKKRKINRKDEECEQEPCVVQVLPPVDANTHLHNSIDSLSRNQLEVLMDVMATKIQQCDKKSTCTEVKDCAGPSRPRRNVKSIYATPNKEISQDLLDVLDENVRNEIQQSSNSECIEMDCDYEAPVSGLVHNDNNNARKETSTRRNICVPSVNSQQMSQQNAKQLSDNFIRNVSAQVRQQAAASVPVNNNVDEVLICQPQVDPPTYEESRFAPAALDLNCRDIVDDAVNETSVADAIQNVLGATSDNSGIFLQNYLLGGSTLDSKVRAKILQGLYVELGSLTPRNDFDPKVDVRYAPGVMSQVSLTPARARPPANIHEWIKLFNIFASVYTTQCPKAAPQMFTYVNRIVQLQRKSPQTFVWRFYDEVFRRVKAQYPPLTWHVIHQPILNEAEDMAFNFRQRTQRPNQDQNRQQQGNSSLPNRLANDGTCHKYNRGNCSFAACKYLHACCHCKGKHPAIHCRRISANSSDSGNSNAAPANVRK